jgi:hypothetical protein
VQGLDFRFGNRVRDTGSLLLLGFCLLAASVRAEETARQILDRAKALDDGPRWWDDREQRMELEAKKKGSDPMHLELKAWDRKEHCRKQDSKVEFVAPASKAGILLVGHTDVGAPVGQWMYTPGTRRVRDITGTAKLDRFDVTDFTFRDLDILTDLLNWTDEDAKSTLRGVEEVDGVPCYAIEFEPHQEYVGYPRVVLWLGKDDLVPRQVEFYDAPAPGMFSLRRSDAPVRRYRQGDIRLVDAPVKGRETPNRVPVAHRIEVETPKDGSKTTIRVQQVRFNQDLSKAFFERGGIVGK